MAKKNDAAVAGSKVRKSTKGVPRVTDKVLAMDEAGRKAWLTEKCAGLSDAVRAEVEARLTSLVASGRPVKAGKSKVIDFTKFFEGKSVDQLVAASAAIKSALKAASVAEQAALDKIIADAEQKKIALAAASAESVEA